MRLRDRFKKFVRIILRRFWNCMGFSRVEFLFQGKKNGLLLELLILYFDIPWNCISFFRFQKFEKVYFILLYYNFLSFDRTKHPLEEESILLRLSIVTPPFFFYFRNTIITELYCFVTIRQPRVEHRLRKKRVTSALCSRKLSGPFCNLVPLDRGWSSRSILVVSIIREEKGTSVSPLIRDYTDDRVYEHKSWLGVVRRRR